MTGFLALVSRRGGALDPRTVDRLRRLAGRARRFDQYLDPAAGIAMMSVAEGDADVVARPVTRSLGCLLVAHARLDEESPATGADGDDPGARLVAHYRAAGGATPWPHGEFAFALWDAQHRRLVCARDRFGCRQLYLCELGDELLATNRLRWALALQADPRPHPRAMAGFLLFGDHAWLDKSLTAFSGVRALRPACTLRVENGRQVETAYWQFPPAFTAPLPGRPSALAAGFRERLHDAVRRRATVHPVMLATGGGIDSAAIAASLRGLRGDGSRDVGCCVYYHAVHPSRERHFAQRLADHLGMPMHWIAAEDYPMFSSAPLTTRPLENYNAAPWADLHRYAADHGGVMLEGEAADSLLSLSADTTNLVRRLFWAGYLWRRYGRRPSLHTGLLEAVRRWLGRSNPEVRDAVLPGWIHPDFAARHDVADAWIQGTQPTPTPLHDRHPAIQRALVDADWTTDDLYLAADAPTPDIRDPYLDSDLLDYVLRLPPLPWLYRKHLLRESMRGLLPVDLLDRPKTPLGAVHASLLRQPSSAWLARWRPGEQLREYVDEGHFPRDFAAQDVAGAYLDLRPVLLDRWLSALAAWKRGS